MIITLSLLFPEQIAASGLAEQVEANRKELNITDKPRKGVKMSKTEKKLQWEERKKQKEERRKKWEKEQEEKRIKEEQEEEEEEEDEEDEEEDYSDEEEEEFEIVGKLKQFFLIDKKTDLIKILKKIFFKFYLKK